MTVPVCSLALALACALLAATPVAAQPKEAPLTASTISGPSEIILKNGSWVPVKLRDTIAEGDGARALAGGRLTLLTNNGNSIRLAQLTQIFVFEPPASVPAGGPTVGAPLKVKLDGGRIWVSVLPLTVTRAPIEVEAGHATVGVRSGGTSLRTNSDGSVLVRCYHGLGVVRATSGPAWERPLKGGEELLVPLSGAPPATRLITSDPEEVNWVKWNSDQDIVAYGMPAPK
ncbi:MAG TPA: FecR domain-containing protein [Verrucomicrobiae bacterium]|jgi:FecR-like protein|nr:FecR domain-containing protein [Verrucomicrobiae bacterium]